MKIFNSSVSKKLDAYTIEHEPVSSFELMERAASAVAFEIMSHWKRNVPIIVFAGPGNNGGDALAVSRMLIEEGYKPEIFLFNTSNKLSPDCQKNKQRLLAMPECRFTEITNQFIPPKLSDDMLVIDGLFGSGLHSPLTSGYAALAQLINSYNATVVSIDLPSGLFGEDNRQNNNRNIVAADYTFTFQFPKLSFLMSENEHFTGKWKVLDIGLHPDILAQTPSPFYYVEPEDAARLLKKRRKFASKRDLGHSLLVSGSYGMMGAAVLAAKACLHTGAGLVSIHAPRCGYPVLQSSVPEALFCPDKNDLHFSSLQIQQRYDAIGIGPGLGRHIETASAFKALISQLKRPSVVDADALNLIAESPEILDSLPPYSILTPHTGEFDRLFGKCETSYERVFKAKDEAKKRNLIIVLKGAYTATVLPKGEIYFNSTGNAGMATAGSGDVLTGVITGLLSQGYLPAEAAVLGVCLHGLAGDLAAATESEAYITAGDIISYLGKARLQLERL